MLIPMQSLGASIAPLNLAQKGGRGEPNFPHLNLWNCNYFEDYMNKWFNLPQPRLFEGNQIALADTEKLFIINNHS